jgi:HEAT repeat protein
VFVAKNQPPPADVLAPVVEKLLNDEDKSVRKEALRATWGVPVSEAAEKRMIELSRTADSAGDAVYFGLSTRPKKSKAVCERLIEVMRGEGGEASDKGRAAWGLTYGVSAEASDLVAKAMIEEVDETLDDYVREQCIRTLGGSGSEEALKKLRDLAEHDESERVRNAAKQALRGR